MSTAAGITVLMILSSIVIIGACLYRTVIPAFTEKLDATGDRHYERETPISTKSSLKFKGTILNALTATNMVQITSHEFTASPKSSIEVETTSHEFTASPKSSKGVETTSHESTVSPNSDQAPWYDMSKVLSDAAFPVKKTALWKELLIGTRRRNYLQNRKIYRKDTASQKAV